MRKFLQGMLTVLFVWGIFLAGSQGMNIAEAKVYGTGVVDNYRGTVQKEYEVRDNDCGDGGKYAIVNVKDSSVLTTFDYDGTWFTTYEYGRPDSKRKFICDGIVLDGARIYVDDFTMGFWTGNYYLRTRSDGMAAYFLDGNEHGDSLLLDSNIMFWEIASGHIKLQ